MVDRPALIRHLFRKWILGGLQATVFFTAPGVAQERLAAPLEVTVEAEDRRSMTVEDVLALEGLGEVVFSPDGEWIAAVIHRGRSGSGGAPPGNLLGDDARGDIWLLSPDGAARRNLTEGIRDGSAHWKPTWSPDGEQLAMLSSRGGDNVRLHLWDRKTDLLRPLSDQGVELNARIKGADDIPREFAWLNDSTIITVLLPTGDASLQFDHGIHSPLVAAREWERAREGSGATVSVIDAGSTAAGDTALMQAARAQIALLDTRGGGPRLIASVPVYGPALQIAVAPGSVHAAVVLSTDHTYGAPPALDRANWGARHRVGVLELSEGSEIRWVPGIAPAFAFANRHYSGRGFGHGFAVGWSPDGRSLALLGAPTGHETRRPSVFLIHNAHLGEALPELISPEEWGPATLFWAGSQALLIHASECHLTTSRSNSCGPVDSPAPLAWWMLKVGAGQPPSRLPSGPDAWEGNLVYSRRERAVYGVARGALWRLETRSREANRLTAESAGWVEGIAWPHKGVPVDSPVLVLSIVRRGQPELRLFDTRTDQVHPASLPVPHPTGEVSGYLPDLDAALVRSGRSAEGPFLWCGRLRSAEVQPLLALNPWLAAIAPAQRRLIEYRGADGLPLHGLVLLPPGHQEGRRYPLVVWVYAGSKVQDIAFSAAAQPNVPTPYHPEIFTGRGYAVLFPSMPLPPDGLAGDPYLEMPKGVMPAINEVIDLGLADADRIGLFGVSYGGYSVFSLISQTDRFAAAVGLAGITNLVSLYGTFDPRKRYDSDPYANLGQAVLAEGGQLRMGAAPWKDLWRYLRNSPIHYVDRINTPLMMIHGDFDYVPIQQVEELFSALHRRGRAVRLVRYWGEGHGITTPPNVRDMWSRILDWYDAHLTAGGGANNSDERSAPPAQMGLPQKK